jgi:hypothetical protein
MRRDERPAPNRDALEAAIAVHDEAALGLFRQAGRHLREATTLARQLDRLDRDERRAQP